MGRLFIVAVTILSLCASMTPDAAAKTISTAKSTSAKTVQKHAKKSVKQTKVRLAKRKRRLASKKAKKALAANKIMFTGRFIWSVPPIPTARLTAASKAKLKERFLHGDASAVSSTALTAAGVFADVPLRGGIFERRDSIKYIIMHSTETGRKADAKRVIKSWNRGMSHPGAQYVVDRDGVIYQAVDPQFGTVHVNVNRTLFGVNNDNSVGIEMVRAEEQKYTKSQLASVNRLVSYLQGRYSVADERVLGHGQVQPSDRLDPVGFNWDKFAQAKAQLKEQLVAYRYKTRSAKVKLSNSNSGS